MTRKWSFSNRDIGGCMILEVSEEPRRVVAIIPRPTRDQGGQLEARRTAQEIVLAHNDSQES